MDAPNKKQQQHSYADWMHTEKSIIEDKPTPEVRNTNQQQIKNAHDFQTIKEKD